MKNLVYILSSFLLFSCRMIEKSNLNLVGGEVVEDESDFSSVIIWSDARSVYDGYCTGAKVGNFHILTAAHCVLEQKNTRAGRYVGPWVLRPSLSSGSKLWLSFSNVLQDEDLDQSYIIEKVLLPAPVVECLDEKNFSKSRCTGRVPLPDLAVIKIKASKESEFAQLPPAQLDLSHRRAQDEILLLGYGSEGDDESDGLPRLKSATTVVASDDEVASSLEGTYAELDGVPSSELFFASIRSKRYRSNLGFGDSGGPVMINGKITGVNSDGFCPLNSRNCNKASNSFFSRLSHTTFFIFF